MPDNFNLIEFGLEGRRVAQQDLAYLQGKVSDQSRRKTYWLREVRE